MQLGEWIPRAHPLPQDVVAHPEPTVAAIRCLCMAGVIQDTLGSRTGRKYLHRSAQTMRMVEGGNLLAYDAADKLDLWRRSGSCRMRRCTAGYLATNQNQGQSTASPLSPVSLWPVPSLFSIGDFGAGGNINEIVLYSVKSGSGGGGAIDDTRTVPVLLRHGLIAYTTTNPFLNLCAPNSTTKSRRTVTTPRPL